MRRVVRALLAVLLVAGAATGLAPAQATSWTSASYASRLVQLVNQARQQQGLRTVTVASGTSEVAASWTAHLDAAQSLSHNPDLRHQLETHGSPDWTTYGENVGQGPAGDPDALFKAYMNSSEHRANILNDAYRFTGVAVVLDGDTAWNTFDFVDAYHAAKPSSSAPKPDAKPKPAPTMSPRRPAVTSTPSGPPVSSAPTSPGVHPRPQPSAVVRTSKAEVKGTTWVLPHTGQRPGAAAAPDLARLLGGAPAAGARSTTHVLTSAARPLPPARPASSELVIAVAGLLLGFVGVRWWQVVRAA